MRATKAVYAFGQRRRLVSSNPFKNVVVERQRRTQLRPLHLYDDEIKTMLKAASAVADTSTPDNAARRWVPWLLAYTGARPSEVTQLRSHDVKKIDGVWCLDFSPEAGAIKTDEARAAALHPHLIEQGFIEWAKDRNGPLFYRPRRDQQDATDVLKQKTPPAAQARQRLADWVREDRHQRSAPQAMPSVLLPCCGTDR